MAQSITDNGIRSDINELNQVDDLNNAGMESIHRVAKLPMVESGIQAATSLYSKVKDYNGLTQWTLSTAEGTVHTVAGITSSLATPVVSHLQQPMKRVDEILCSGLDYVEEKVPAIKMPPGEIYTGAKERVNHAVEGAKHYAGPAVETAKHLVEPAVETAKHYVEPAVESAKHLVEPAVERACALRDYGVQQVEKMIHKRDEKGADEDEENEATANGSI